MSFFQLGQQSALVTAAGYSVEILRKNECTICPLNLAPGLCHPKIKPHGSSRPLVYVLGEAPGGQEDEQGRFFVGPSGNLLKRFLPPDLLPHIRWSNVTRCFPGKGKTPGPIEIEACRPSIIRDIEACKPTAIFGFGNVPLNWALGEAGITKWAGRRVPVKIGSHTCWYYPFVHPAAILRAESQFQRGPYSSEDEFAFAFQLRRAVDELESLPEPKVHTAEEALKGLSIVTGAHGDDDLDRVRDFLAELRDDLVIGFDYETKGIRPYRPDTKILSVALAGSRHSMSIALLHRQAGWTGKQRVRLGGMLRQFMLGSRERRLVSHNLPFEIEWSAHWFGEEVIWGTEWGDTASQAYILDERPWTLSLDFVVKQYFGLSIKALHNLDRDNLDDADIELVLRYNALDAKYHRLAFLVQDRCLREERLMPVYRHQLERTIAVVPSQLVGVPIDHEMNRYLEARYRKRLAKIEGTMASSQEVQLYLNRTGSSFRPSALDDIRRYLVVVLGRREFESRAQSLDEATLTRIKDPLIKLVLRWRKVNKILSTYILPVRHDSQHVYPDGHMHPIISTTRTRTWRTSGSEPNTQNWPKRDAAAMEARTQIFAGPGNRIVAFDFAGIQARNVAMESGDPRLVQAFHERYDIHRDWAQRLAKLAPGWIPGGWAAAEKDKDLLKKYRYLSKNKFVFPSFFGARPKSISRQLGVEINIADRLQRMFWEEFPSIKQWQDNLVTTYYKLGYVTGLSGFRRRAPVIYNELINSPIQSDESIIVCDAMIRIAKLGLPCAMEIHDDLTFVLPKEKIDECADLIITEMLRITFPWVNVPLEVEMSVGEDWGTMKEVGKFESVGKDKWRELPK